MQKIIYNMIEDRISPEIFGKLPYRHEIYTGESVTSKVSLVNVARVNSKVHRSAIPLSSIPVSSDPKDENEIQAKDEDDVEDEICFKACRARVEMVVQSSAVRYRVRRRDASSGQVTSPADGVDKALDYWKDRISGMKCILRLIIEVLLNEYECEDLADDKYKVVLHYAAREFEMSMTREALTEQRRDEVEWVFE